MHILEKCALLCTPGIDSSLNVLDGRKRLRKSMGIHREMKSSADLLVGYISCETCVFIPGLNFDS
jgi:hypothetical protein